MTVPSDAPRQTRRWWRWIKRLLLAGIATVVLAVIFHAPLLRWGNVLIEFEREENAI